MTEAEGKARPAKHDGARPSPARSAWRHFSGAVRAVNRFSGLIAGLLIVISCIVITNEVVWRYYLRHPHTWNLEVNIFLLIAATFLASGYTQMRRAHVGTEVLQSFMPAHWNRWRLLLGDILSLLFCAFVTVKVWQYAWQAWSEGWTTESTWAPHLWIPYALIGLGLTLITLEYLVQVAEAFGAGGTKDRADDAA